ncbi:MAG: transglutaminase-like domain-containing protein, partial [Actinomycetes bacterium]
MTALVEQVTASAGDPYAQMLALQNWFRAEFTYDDGVDYASEPDALGAFLADRRGFCQQFSSTFALFARSLGVPSRVAVGFTQGDQVGTGADGQLQFVVRGRHAHAWPEVYFEGVGWVPFEPTPQRGNPQAQSYTGVAPDQAPAPPEQEATTTSTSAPSTTTLGSPTSTPSELDATAT